MTALFDLNDTCESDPAIEALWETLSPELGNIARRWFTVMKNCGPDVLEVIHDNAPTACIGRYAMTYVWSFTAHVNVGFFYGAFLPDPAKILQGTGKRMRHVKLRPGEPAPEDALHALISAAYEDLHQRITALPAITGNRKLTDLVNIGGKIAGRLNEAGIFTEDELRLVGPVEAHRRIKNLYPNETIPVCYYLYSFEGALTDTHWDKIPDKKKQALKGLC